MRYELQVNGIFEFVIKNDEGKEETFTVDLKKEGAVLKGKGPNKADAILSLKDADFIDLASGKLNGKFTSNVKSLSVEVCWC